MNLKYKLFIHLLSIILPLFLFQDCISEVVEKFKVNITYLSLPMSSAEISLTKIDSIQNISVNASSRSIVTAFYKIDNQYLSVCENDFHPKKYEKNILQGDFKEKKLILFNSKDSSVIIKDLLKGTEKTISPVADFNEIYDIFSALFHIRFAGQKTDCSLFCFANCNIWKVKFSYLGRDILDFSEKEYKTLKYLVEFKQISKNNSSRTDILTNNLVNEKHHLILWFSDDELRLPIKAKYVMFPFSVYWHLESYWHKD